MKTKEVSFGTVACESANHCSVRMEIRNPDKVTLTFSWRRTPSPDDREEWGCTILEAALETAMQQAFAYRAIIEAIRRQEAAGVIERCGITKDGDWCFRGTKQNTAGRVRGGIINLARVRAQRRGRRSRSRSVNLGARGCPFGLPD
jgi:hypothetical protein